MKKNMIFYRVNTFDGQTLYPMYGEVWDNVQAAINSADSKNKLADTAGIRVNYIVTVEVI